MSHVSDSEDQAFIPATPTRTSEHGSSPSLRSWTIPRLMAELRSRGISFAASARKAELFRLLFPTQAIQQPSTSADQASVLTALTQIHTMLNTLSTSVQLMQDRMDVLEARPAGAVVPGPPHRLA